MSTDVDPNLALRVSERHEREWTRHIGEIATADHAGPGIVATSPSRVDDLIATLHAVHAPVTRDAATPDRLSIGEGDATWLVHTDPPASLTAYIAALGEIPTITSATIFSAPADFVRRRHDADGDISTLAGIDAMQGYVEWRGCRHQAIAGYLGADHPGGCGHCDNCDRPPAGLMDGDDAKRAVDVVLQTGERFGVKHLVSVLRGERTPTVDGQGHDRLDAWNQGAARSRAGWDAVFRQLVAAGVLSMNSDGGVVTTPLSNAVHTGERTIRFTRHLELPDAPMPKRRGVAASKPTKSTATSDGPKKRVSTTAKPISARATEEAKRTLYRWRTAYAAELGVPAIRILTDPDISRLIVRRPDTMDELRRVVTPSRCDAYGDAILAALADL